MKKQTYEEKLKVLFPPKISAIIAEGHYRRMITDHDCTLSPEDGCQCQEWRRELMKYENNQI